MARRTARKMFRDIVVHAGLQAGGNVNLYVVGNQRNDRCPADPLYFPLSIQPATVWRVDVKISG